MPPFALKVQTSLISYNKAYTILGTLKNGRFQGNCRFIAPSTKMNLALAVRKSKETPIHSGLF